MEPDPCHYGVPRDQCHVGCPEHYCWAARRAQSAFKQRLAKRHEEEAPLYTRLAGHDACGTADCCGSCGTAVR